MPQDPKTSSSHRNGGRAQVLPTSDRMDNISKPHSMRATITNAPDPLLYGLAFALIGFGLTFLIVGGVYSKQCALEPMLPIWLLVMGIIVAFGGGWHGFTVWRIKKEPFRKVGGLEKVVGTLIFLVFIGWFIAGNVWVYKAWGEVPDYGHYWFENGCNKSVFVLSFIAVITMDGVVGIFLIGFCFWGVSKVVVRE